VFPVPAYAPFRQNVNGGLGGGQIGYNWQLDRTWVLGLEGDIQWTGERSSMSLTAVGPRYGAFVAKQCGDRQVSTISRFPI
jgi:outer membrane immunogenic protein